MLADAVQTGAASDANRGSQPSAQPFKLENSSPSMPSATAQVTIAMPLLHVVTECCQAPFIQCLVTRVTV